MDKNVLYLQEMGVNDNNISTNIKNHRIRVLKNIDIIYEGVKYNMFFEFTQGAHRRLVYTNSRTGAPLKKPVEEVVVKDGVYLDTQYTTSTKDSDGHTWFDSWRHLALEKEFRNEHLEYTKENILKIVNRYKIGEPFTEVCLIEETAKSIIEKDGDEKARDIVKDGRDFQKEGSYYFKVLLPWADHHKRVSAVRQIWEPIENGKRLRDSDSVIVDLITRRIVHFE